MINNLEDVFDFVIGLWAIIILFATFPLWILPYIIVSRMAN